MKKIVWIVLTVCLAGIFAGCDKDEEWNPFVGTTWKHRNEEVKYGQIVYTYDVIRFMSKKKFVKWMEDESGNIISPRSTNLYVIDRSQSLIILDPNYFERRCTYDTDNPPSFFWYKYNDSDERTYYYRQ